jgi:hypothetical protein
MSPQPDPVDWDAMDRLPEWEVTARMTREAQFRVHAASPEDAADMAMHRANGVRSMQDLYDGDMQVDYIISTEAVTGP